MIASDLLPLIPDRPTSGDTAGAAGPQTGRELGLAWERTMDRERSGMLERDRPETDSRSSREHAAPRQPVAGAPRHGAAPVDEPPVTAVAAQALAPAAPVAETGAQAVIREGLPYSAPVARSPTDSSVWTAAASSPVRPVASPAGGHPVDAAFAANPRFEVAPAARAVWLQPVGEQEIAIRMRDLRPARRADAERALQTLRSALESLGVCVRQGFLNNDRLFGPDHGQNMSPSPDAGDGLDIKG